MEVLHTNHPIQVIQNPEMDCPSLRLVDGFTIPAHKSDLVYATLLQTAMALTITRTDLIVVGDALSNYINS